MPHSLDCYLKDLHQMVRTRRPFKCLPPMLREQFEAYASSVLTQAMEQPCFVADNFSKQDILGLIKIAWVRFPAWKGGDDLDAIVLLSTYSKHNNSPDVSSLLAVELTDLIQFHERLHRACIRDGRIDDLSFIVVTGDELDRMYERARKRHVRFVARHPYVCESLDQFNASSTVNDEIRLDVQESLRSLPSDVRVYVERHDMYDESIESISKDLGHSIRKGYYQLFRGRRLLQRLLAVYANR
jgi:hypothetical protein